MEVNRSPRRGEVQSIHRALDILEAVGRHGEVGTSQLARDLDLAVSTVHSLVRTLTARGYLLRGRSGYRIGPGATTLAWKWDARLSLSFVLEPALRQLAEDTEHAAVAALVVGKDAHIVGYQPAPGLVTVGPGPQGPTNPLSWATGRVVVGMTRQPDWPAFVAAGGQAEPEWSEEDWYVELERIAQSGLSVKHYRDASGQMLTSLGVPVCGPADFVLCSIGCSMIGKQQGRDLSRTLDILWDVAVRLSEGLGGHVPRAKPSIRPRPAG